MQLNFKWTSLPLCYWSLFDKEVIATFFWCQLFWMPFDLFFLSNVPYSNVVIVVCFFCHNCHIDFAIKRFYHFRSHSNNSWSWLDNEIQSHQIIRTKQYIIAFFLLSIRLLHSHIFSDLYHMITIIIHSVRPFRFVTCWWIIYFQ